MIRSILAVAGGFAGMTVLVGAATALSVRLMLPTAGPGEPPHPTPAYLVVNLIYSALSAAIGGFVAALLAGREPIAHAVVLAGIVLVMSLISMKLYAGQQPPWYQFILLVFMPLFVVGGGLLNGAVAVR